MTQTERMQMIVFAMGMLVAAGLSIRASVSGVFDLPPRDRSRVQTLLAPIVLDPCLHRHLSVGHPLLNQQNEEWRL